MLAFMTRTSLIALCSAMSLPDGAGDAAVPEWVHLLPAGAIRTQDNRGPYTVTSMQAVAQASLAQGEKLPIDECHAIDRAAPEGRPAPARGWIVALEAREDGLWGKVDWTEAGKALMADKAYRGISPVIAHTKDKRVLAVRRASLINTPNLVGLASLHSEDTEMDWKAMLLELLGLGSDADDAAITAAIEAKKEAGASQHGQEDYDRDGTVTALQGELAEMATKYNTLAEGIAQDKATSFVDGAIAEGRVGVKPMRDRYVAMHMADPVGTEEIIGALPRLTGSTHAAELAPEVKSGDLTAADRQIIAMMGLDEAAYKESLAASGKKEEAL